MKTSCQDLVIKFGKDNMPEMYFCAFQATVNSGLRISATVEVARTRLFPCLLVCLF